MCYLGEGNYDADQTARMRRVIRAFVVGKRKHRVYRDAAYVFLYICYLCVVRSPTFFVPF